nr:G2/mitotic-specific cyclin-B3 [Camelus dromedarius]
MPLPVPPQCSKPEAKKSQSSKIVPSDHGTSQKRGENCQTKRSPSSPLGPLKKRSAFEDLTNAFQSQPAQPKKEANNEFVKDISKKTNRNTPACELAKNKMNVKRYKLEPSPVVVSTTMVPNIIDKPLIPEISTISKTPTTEEASLLKKPFVLKEKPTTENTTLIKRSLSLKKCTNQGEVALFEEPLSLLEETESDVVESMIFGKNHKAGEAAIIKRTLSLMNMSTHQEKQSCSEEFLTLVDISDEEDFFPVEPTNSMKKPKTEEATPTEKLLSLKKKCSTKGEISCMKNPLVLQKTTSDEKSLTKELLSFRRKPTTEKKPLFQKPPALQEKHTTEQEVSIFEKSLVLQEEIDTEEDSLFEEPLAFKKQPTTKKTLIFRQLCLKKNYTIQRKIPHSMSPLVFQKTTSGEEASIKESLSLRKKPTTKEESFFQELSVSQGMHTTDGEVTLLKEPWALQEEKDSEDEFLMEQISFRKKCTTKEATLSKKPLPLKEKCTTHGKVYHFKKSLVLQTITSEEKSFVKEPLSFQKKPIPKESLFQESSVLQEKHTTQEEESTLKKPLVLQKTPTFEKESLLKEPLAFKKHTIEEATSTKKPLPLKEKCTTHGKVCRFLKPPVLQPTTEEESLVKEQLALQEKHTTQEDVAVLKKPWAFEENIDGKDEFLMEPVSFWKKHTTNVADCANEPLSLKKKKCITQIMAPICQELLDLQNVVAEGKGSFSMESVSFQKKSSTDEAVLTKTPLSLKNKQIAQGKMFLLKKPLITEKTTPEKESLSKKLLFLKKKSTTEEEFLFQDPSVLKEKPTTLQDVSHSKKPLTLQEKITTEEESYIKEPLTLEEKPTTEEEFPFQEPFSPHVKPTNNGEALLCKALTLEKKTDTKEGSLKKLLTLQEESTTEEESLFKKPLFLKEELSTEVSTSTERQLSLKKKPSAQGEVLLLKEQLALQEDITSEEESLIKQPQALQEKPSIEKETILRESLDLQENPRSKETLIKEPLALQENLTHKEDTSLKDFLILQVETSPHVSTTAPEAGTGMPSTVTMSNVGKFSTMSKSSACESSSSKLFSPQDKKSQKEMTPLEDTDKDHNDPHFNSVYAKDIFNYTKEREEKFILKKYMNRQTDINSDMRAILVDWLVEVQITFEMRHETLYLAVKFVDHYLMEVICKKDKLQLLGATAFLIAAKFEESCPQYVDDFLYICEDIYKRDEMLAMEISILQTLKFDVNIPIAYHFLRRYARCVHASMKTLTLSRFICEMTLQEYDYIEERASKLAAGSFLLALYMEKLGHWAPTLEYYSGYKTSDLHPLVRQLNTLLTSCSCNKLKTVHSKYSHQVFFEVTKIPPLDPSKLEEILNCC